MVFIRKKDKNYALFLTKNKQLKSCPASLAGSAGFALCIITPLPLRGISPKEEKIQYHISELQLNSTYLAPLQGGWGVKDKRKPKTGKRKDVAKSTYLQAIRKPKQEHESLRGIICPFVIPVERDIIYFHPK